MQCYAVWKILLLLWKPCRWIRPATSGPQLVISFRRSLRNSLVFCHWRYDIWTSETSSIGTGQNVLKQGEGCGWEIKVGCCEYFLMIQLMFPEDWIYCMSDPSLYLYFPWITLTTLTRLLFTSLLAFFLGFPCPVFVRLKYCNWENQHFGGKKKKKSFDFNCWNKRKLSGRAAIPNWFAKSNRQRELRRLGTESTLFRWPDCSSVCNQNITAETESRSFGLWFLSPHREILSTGVYVSRCLFSKHSKNFSESLQ